LGHARLLLSLYEENLFSGGAFALDICCSFPNISINQKTVSFSLPFTLFNSYNLSVSSIIGPTCRIVRKEPVKGDLCQRR